MTCTLKTLFLKLENLFLSECLVKYSHTTGTIISVSRVWTHVKCDKFEVHLQANSSQNYLLTDKEIHHKKAETAQDSWKRDFETTKRCNDSRAIAYNL